MTKRAYIGLLILLIIGAGAWFAPVVLPSVFPARTPSVAQAPRTAPSVSPASAPGSIVPPLSPQAASAAARGAVVEEVREGTDSESALQSILPRRSAGHAAGLHKTQDELRLGSSAALVLDANTRQVLYGKNPDAVLPMASITKLMTAMVALEAQLPLDTPITIAEEDVDKILSSRSRLRVGTVITRGEALRLALMSSENRASHAIARTSPAGMEAFIAAMNRKARQLGMTNTTFVDPTGLSNKNQSSARDLATMVLAASAHPLIREYSTTREHQTAMGNRVLLYRNSDPLVKDPTWDITLQKTGYIIEAGHCVVLRTRLDGQDVVMVLLDSASNGRRSADARRIRQWIAGDPVAERPQAAAASPRKQVTAKAAAKAAAKANTKTSAKSRAGAPDKGKRVQATFAGTGSNTRKSGGPGKN
ncbi:serine hydrolase [Caenimonas sp. SL110]|uniref:serine hydrolase n=1 Tax=Caenimonas sp. SL110 TaxID=1450524 RepID=UPI00069D8A06|nr:serine hydrolase [Caenimonas sp. SL110]